MDMCLLEVAMCQKCRSRHFQSEGELKSLRTEVGGVKKKLRLGAGEGRGVSTPLHAINKIIKCFTITNGELMYLKWY